MISHPPSRPATGGLLLPVAASVAHHAARGAEKLRQQHSVAKLVAVQIMTSPFADTPQYRPYIVVPLVQPSSDTLLITKAALAGLRHVFRPGFRYHKAGIMLLEIGDEGVQQSDLFAAPPDPRRARLMAAMDKINRDWGRGTLRTAAEQLTADWHMRQDLRSPCYSTRIDQLLSVG